MSTWDPTPQAELGTCVGVLLLVPGDVDGVRAVAARLDRVGEGASRVSELLSKVDAGQWVGQSGEVFRSAVAQLPAPYGAASRAFGESGRTLVAYADAVEDARAVAARAVMLWNDAEMLSQSWRWQQAQWQDAGGDVVLRLLPGAAPGLRPATDDPGEPGREQARLLLGQAQLSTRQAAELAAGVLRGGASEAPVGRGQWQGLAAGTRDSVVGTAKLGWALTVSPDRGAAWTALGGGIKDAAAHPVDTAHGALTAAAEDPNYALGGALPGILTSLLGGGGLIARGLRDTPGAVPDAPGGFRDLLSVHGFEGFAKTLSLNDRTLMSKAADGDGHGGGRSAHELRLRDAASIADHAYVKHVLQKKEFPDVHSPAELAAYVERVMEHPSESNFELPGRRLFWDDANGVIVIAQDPPHPGSVFHCSRAYYDTQVREAIESASGVNNE